MSLEGGYLRPGLKGVYYGTRAFFTDHYRHHLADRRYEPLWETVCELKVPVFWEVAAPPWPKPQRLVLEFSRLKEWAARHPDIPSILTHGIHPEYLIAGLPEPMAQVLANDQFLAEVLYPISRGRAHEYPYPELRTALRELYRRVGGRRLIWGSDIPNVERHCTYCQSLNYLRRYCDFIPSHDMDRRCHLEQRAATTMLDFKGVSSPIERPPLLQLGQQEEAALSLPPLCKAQPLLLRLLRPAAHADLVDNVGMLPPAGNGLDAAVFLFLLFGHEEAPQSETEAPSAPQLVGQVPVVTTENGRITIQVPMRFKRRSGRKEIVLPNGDARQSSPVQESLVVAVARAHRWLALLEEGRFRSVGDLAEAVGMDASLVRRHLGLTSLRPDLIRRILDGDEPDGLSLRELLPGVPVRWEEQVATARRG